MIEQPAPNVDLRCTTCGYGVVRLRPPNRCPMCTGNLWQQRPQRHAATDLRTGEADTWPPMSQT